MRLRPRHVPGPLLVAVVVAATLLRGAAAQGAAAECTDGTTYTAEALAQAVGPRCNAITPFLAAALVVAHHSAPPVAC